MESRGNVSKGQNDGAGDGQRTRADARLVQAITAAITTTGARAELAAAARNLVEELRQKNEPPEQMLLHIKRLLSAAGLRPSYALAVDATAPIGPEAAVYRDVIAWSIRFYYADSEGNDGPSAL